ncbi:MAG: hypothetical protein WC498_03795 [Candidatus Saccharimonadales bacterium]
MNRLRLHWSLGLLGIALPLIVAAVLWGGSAIAATQSGTWLSATEIQVNATTYTNCKLKDNCVPPSANAFGMTSANDGFFPKGWVNTTESGPYGSPIDEFCKANNISQNVGKSVVLVDTSTNKASIFKITTPAKGSGGITYCFGNPDDLTLSNPTPTLSGNFVNHSTIRLSNGTVYTDSVSDKNLNYYDPAGKTMDATQGCATGVIENFSPDQTTATLYTITQGVGQYANCTKTKYANVRLKVDLYNAAYAWTSPTTISASDGSGVLLTADKAGSTTLTATDGSCKVTLTVASGDSTQPTTGKFTSAGSDCTVKVAGKVVLQNGGFPTETVHIAPYSADAVQANKNTNVAGPPSSGLDCDFSGNPLTWIVCPLVDAAKDFITKVDNFITGALTFDVKGVFHDQTGYYTAWNSFRVLATALLVIGGLVMVASQALGFEFLDAYTIRKVLPRMFIAVIGISLSWPLMEFAITFVNTLGVDLRQLIETPFSTTLHGTFGGSTLLAANLGLILTGAFIGIAGALSFGLTAALALLVGFAIIVVRDLALIVIIILAPIAIASYILPNTQKLWKLWSDNFLGLLLVFPIIEAFIAIGRVFSAVALSGTGTNSTGAGTVSQIIGFAAYFLPYFLLPMAFRLATGAIGALSGMVNDRGRGAFDRLKKFRGNKIMQNSAAMRGGTRFNNRGLNALTSRASTRNLGFGARGAAAYNQKLDLAAMEHAKSAGGLAVQHNDGALQALTYGSAIEAEAGLRRGDFGEEAKKEANIKAAIGAAQASGGFGRARQVYAAQQLAATGTGYENIEQVAQTIARVSHGNAGQASSLAGNINSTTKQALRYDLAPGYKQLNDLSQKEMAGGSAKPITKDYNTATIKAAQGVDPVTLLRGKPAQVKNLANALAQEYVASGNSDPEIHDQIGYLLGSISYASPENQRAINEAGLNGFGIKPITPQNPNDANAPTPPAAQPPAP